MHWSDSRIQISNRVKDGLVEFVQPFPLQSSVEDLTYTPAVPPKLDILLVAGHSVLNGCKLTVRVCRAGEMYPNHSEEGTGGGESDLSRLDNTGVLCGVQSLDECI